MKMKEVKKALPEIISSHCDVVTLVNERAIWHYFYRTTYAIIAPRVVFQMIISHLVLQGSRLGVFEQL